MIAQFYSEECAENFNTSYTYSHRYTNHCIGDRSSLPFLIRNHVVSPEDFRRLTLGYKV